MASLIPNFEYDIRQRADKSSSPIETKITTLSP